MAPARTRRSIPFGVFDISGCICIIRGFLVHRSQPYLDHLRAFKSIGAIPADAILVRNASYCISNCIIPQEYCLYGLRRLQDERIR